MQSDFLNERNRETNACSDYYIFPTPTKGWVGATGAIIQVVCTATTHPSASAATQSPWADAGLASNPSTVGF